MKVIIRKSKPSDLEDFIALEMEFEKYHKKFKKVLKPAEPTRKKLKKLFKTIRREKAFFYVAEINNKVVGSMYGFIKKVNWRNMRPRLKKIAELNSDIVLKKYRGLGIGKKLAAKFFKWVKKNNIRYVEMSANIHNKDSIKFHEKLGFKQTFVKFGKLL